MAVPSPPFTADELVPARLAGGIGRAFQDLMFETYGGTEGYEHLRWFPAHGRDGGIDLLDDPPSRQRTAVECKHVGRAADVMDRWSRTAANLSRNLPARTDPNYAPWWNRERPIRRYVFCTSALLTAPGQVDLLRGRIEETFATLAREHDHLAHLADLQVVVLHWGDVLAGMARRPYLLFRWLNAHRLPGLAPLDADDDAATFRSYLRGKLPYYSQEDHCDTHPAPSRGITTPERVLASLRDYDTAIVTGPGGHGKTRFTLECGRLAERDGWTVLRTDQLTTQGIDAVASAVEDDTRVLFVVDYLEHEPNFATCASYMSTLNATAGFQMKIVANCRTSYYRQVATLGNHTQVTLDPGHGLEDWYLSYRRATVRHILAASGIAPDERLLDVCGDVPVLAVFAAYLHDSGKRPQLDELTEVREFGTWVRRRVRASFPEIAEGELAQLLALFPLPAHALEQLAEGDQLRLVTHLERDGWIELTRPEDGGPELWTTVHDVFADQVICTYLAELGSFAAPFVRSVFARAAELGVLPAAVRALQRLAPRDELAALNWLELFTAELRADPERWIGVSGLLIRTPLLSDRETITLLDRNVALFETCLPDAEFRRGIAWLAERLAGVPGEEQDDEAARDGAEQLAPWLERALAQREEAFLVAAALRLLPERFAARAFAWIEDDAALRVDVVYVLFAWLMAGRDRDRVRDQVVAWLEVHPLSDKVGLLVRGWLEAKGPQEVVLPAVLRWLEKRRTDVHAWFIFMSWLLNGGEAAPVRDDLLTWLEQHAEHPDAWHVLRLWLGREGELEREPVRGAVVRWLRAHGDEMRAGRIVGAWLDAGGPLEPVAEFAELWLRAYGDTPAGAAVLPRWLENDGGWQPVSEAFEALIAVDELVEAPEAQWTLSAWLLAGGPPERAVAAMRRWLDLHGLSWEAQHLFRAWLAMPEPPATIERDVAEWLKRHGSAPATYRLFEAWLDGGGNKEIVRARMLQWLRQNATEANAGLVLESWLRAGGEPEAVRTIARRWLKVFGRRPQAWGFVEAWRAAGGDRGTLRGYHNVAPWRRRPRRRSRQRSA